MNRLKIDNLTQEVLLGPVYNLLKGTCQSSIELKYKMEECYKALTERLDWENPECDRCLFDLSKPLPLKGHLGHLTVATKAAKYDLKFIEDMIHNQWSPIKINKFSPHDVYSTLRVLSMVSVQVEKLHGYEYLKEIVVQHKLFNLEGSDIVDLAVALRMFTRRIIIQKHVEDV
ncbi:hypothetical protein Tco_0488139 [Tanacetum coccineum]